jgi:type IV pilus assembly protein PilY1
LYRVDFSDALTLVPLSTPQWTITQVAQTTGAGRKFLEAPAALALKDRAYIAIGSGDREQPLISQYPYADNVANRFYMFIDRFASGSPANLDDSTTMANFTSPTTCTTTLDHGFKGWYMDLNTGRGEQTVTSALIFGGIIYFSTNRPTASLPGMCSPNLGEARGYAVNLLNASGAVGTQAICGGSRSGTFTGGGIPPSPVTATLPINGKPVSVLFGGIQRTGSASSSVGAQKVKPTISGKRTRPYWYVKGNK